FLHHVWALMCSCGRASRAKEHAHGDSAPAGPRLQHGQFVRALALHLLRDPQLADDAAQETWLRYLEHPPADDGRLRGWLRSVVFNWAASSRRSQRHRGDHERRAASSEALPSGVEEIERGELMRRVVEATLALEEPYRATMLE